MDDAGPSGGANGDGKAVTEMAKTSAGNGAAAEGGKTRRAMSIESAKQLLTEKLNTTVDDDDPALIPVYLHEGFLEDYGRMLKRHEATVAEAMALEVTAAVKTVREAAEGLRDETLKGSVRQSLAEVGEYARQIENLKTELTNGLRRTVARQIAIHGVLTFVTAGAALATVLALMNI